MPEAVAVPGGRGDEDAGVHRTARRLVEVVLGEPGRGGQQPVPGGGAALGGQAHDVVRRGGQRVDADQEQVAQRVAQAGAALLAGGDGEFLDEEGVAVAAFEDLVDEGGVRFGAQDAGEPAGGLLPGEAGEPEVPHAAQPVQFGQQGAQRVAAGHVRAVGGQDQQAAGVRGAQEVRQQVPGGGVGPVQVLQGEDDGVPRGGPLQQTGRQLVQPGRALLAVPGRALLAVPARARRVGLRARFGQQPGQFVLPADGRGGEVLGQGPAQRAGRRRRG